MGMDAWVFSRPKENYTKWRELREKLEELRKAANEKIVAEYLKYRDKYPDLPTDVDAEYLKTHFSKEDLKEFREFAKECLENKEIGNTETELYGFGDDKNELKYWRKNYPVHSYIVKHFLEDGKDDNCEPILLTKEGVKEMVSVFKEELSEWEKNGDGREVEWFTPPECDYVSLNDLKETICFFENLIGDFSEDTVFYYYTWY